MKKFASVVAVFALFAFAAPALALTNPFMDVPLNSWAYDAVAQLAANGILSGFPNGTYRGNQPTTRYQMASALARALTVVDMTKASRQDVEMLKKLVVEFKDELDALGVKVNELGEKVSVMEDRLGGWKLSGQLRLDVVHKDQDAPVSENSVKTTRMRLNVERWFGEDESMHFFGRIDGNPNLTFSRFYAEIPFYWDSMMTVGRFAWDLEDEYYLGGATDMANTGGFFGLDSYLSDRTLDAFGFSKEFGMGSFNAYLAHPKVEGGVLTLPEGAEAPADLGAWELFMKGSFQVSEQFGLDVGAQVFFGDNAEFTNVAKFNNLWTLFAGLRYNFNDNIALKGIFYYQDADADAWSDNKWVGMDIDSSNAWKIIADVKQDALQFTSLWLEYGQIDGGFYIPTGTEGVVFAGVDLGSSVGSDLKYWRVGAGQVWNDKWATHLFYYGYDFDKSSDLNEWGLGVQYTYNPSVKFGLNYVKVDWKDGEDDDQIRFRTQVSF